MIEVIAEHSVEMSLLPEKAKILDLGCRGFGFTDYMRLQGHNVCAVDIDELGREDYFRLAIAGHVGRVGIKRSNDPQATCICEGDEVMCMDIPTLSLTCGVDFWDLIKFDIEGSEYEVILSMDRPWAKQLSLEMHLHTGVYTDADVRELEEKLISLGYFPVSHEMSKRHGLGENYWDSLWIERFFEDDKD